MMFLRTGLIALALVASVAALAADKVKAGLTMSTADVPLFIADARGYFRDENIEVEIIPFDTAAKTVAPLATGDLDVAGGSASAGLFNAAERKIDIRVVANRAAVAPGHRYQSVIVRKDLIESGRFKSYSDLKGLKVGIPAPGTGGQPLIDAMTKRGGLAYGDVEQVFLGFPNLVVALQNKAVDVAVMIEPYASAAIDSGAGVFFAPSNDTYPGQEVSLLFYGDKFARERPDVGRRFMKGWLRGARDYNDAAPGGSWGKDARAADVISILARAIGMQDAQIRRTQPQFTHPDGLINMDSLRKDLAFYQEHGFVTAKSVSADAIVDMSFALAAARELGPYKPAP